MMETCTWQHCVQDHSDQWYHIALEMIGTIKKKCEYSTNLCQRSEAANHGHVKKLLTPLRSQICAQYAHGYRAK